MRDHTPIVIEDFKGFWKRGDDETCPVDHFIDCQNVSYSQSAVRTRDGIDFYQTGPPVITNIVRIYNYTLQTGDSLLVLDSSGQIWHCISPTQTFGPILTISGMTDFGFVAIAGRAYITPFTSTIDAKGVSREIGMQNQFLYVYKGDGTAARKAAGPPPISVTALTATPGVAGFSDLGFHIFAVVYETDTGYLTALGPLVSAGGNPNFATATSVSNTQGYTITNIPISPNSYVTKRHIVATKKILNYNQDQDGYQFFFVPNGNIDDNVTTTRVVSFFDIDLLEDASHLIDNFSEIAAGVSLSTYNGRLVLGGQFSDISVIRVSEPGEPEAIDQVDGLIIVPLDGQPITNLQEYRDVLYAFKRTKTFSIVDDGDEPSAWVPVPIDQGIGSPVHGVATVLDSNGVNIEFLMIADLSGIMLFSGSYTRPELSWKIGSFWEAFNRNHFHRIQILNDTLDQIVYMVTPDRRMIIGDYSEGLNPSAIKWAKWKFAFEITTIAFTNGNTLILGSNGVVVP